MLEYFRMVTSGVLPQSYSKVNTTTVRNRKLWNRKTTFRLNGLITMLIVQGVQTTLLDFKYAGKTFCFDITTSNTLGHIALMSSFKFTIFWFSQLFYQTFTKYKNLYQNQKLF